MTLQKVPESGSTSPAEIPHPSGALYDATTSLRFSSGVMWVRKAERMPSCSDNSRRRACLASSTELKLRPANSESPLR